MPAPSSALHAASAARSATLAVLGETKRTGATRIYAGSGRVGRLTLPFMWDGKQVGSGRHFDLASPGSASSRPRPRYPTHVENIPDWIFRSIYDHPGMVEVSNTKHENSAYIAIIRYESGSQDQSTI
jgi:hypothetical protein